MRKTLLTIFIVILGIPLIAQEVHFPPAIVAAGGSSSGGSPTLSRWRLAPVHVITLPDGKLKASLEDENADWTVSVYPNPVEDLLNLEFHLPEQRELILKLTGVDGKVVFIQEARTFINGSVLELNLSGYMPALYLLHITSPDLTSQNIYRIQKL